MSKKLSQILSPVSDNLIEVDRSIIEQLETGVHVIDESTRHLFISGGKKLRASILLASSGLRENEIPDGTVDIAAAAEIVHAATLIHDDIIDQSLMRRGNVSVPQKWGNKVAVLAGDYMYTIGLDTAVRDGNPRLFPVMVNGTSAMVKGELYQLQYSNVDAITEERYYTIIHLKTAHFMGACAHLGGVKAGFDDELCSHLNTFGLKCGYAFQIADDALDIRASSDLGKDSGNDFFDGKVTLPFIFLLNKLSDNDRSDIIRKMKNPRAEDWPGLRDLLIDSGSVDYALDRAAEYIKEGLNSLKLFPENRYRSLLEELAEFFVGREY